MEHNERSAFWLVWSPTGGLPLHRHTTLEMATDEAKRLAERLPGRHFYVLQCLGFEMTGEEIVPMRSGKLRKGTIVHLGGIPVTLVDTTRVKTANAALLDEHVGA